jgi:cation transport ATPase
MPQNLSRAIMCNAISIPLAAMGRRESMLAGMAFSSVSEVAHPLRLRTLTCELISVIMKRFSQ